MASVALSAGVTAAIIASSTTARSGSHGTPTEGDLVALGLILLPYIFIIGFMVWDILRD